MGVFPLSVQDCHNSLATDPQSLGTLYPLHPTILHVIPHPYLPFLPPPPPLPPSYKIFINYPLIVTQTFFT